MNLERPHFVFVTCQVGAEGAVKKELARLEPGFRFAFSRPGFLTFKAPPELRVPRDLELVFGRAYGYSLGKVRGAAPDELAAQVWALFGDRPARRVHAWSRDQRAAGDHGYEPGITAEAQAAAEAIVRHAPRPDTLAPHAADPRRAAKPDEFVLDCVLVEPDEWWIGYHRAGPPVTRWPGGIMPLDLPAAAVSRAWLKMEEALRWSELPIPVGARVVEIGSAPGGSSQALLARGFEVTGVDPAEMHPDVVANPRFRHLRKRTSHVSRREFRKARWLTADMNVAPQYTLDAVESIVTHAEVSIRGMLLTLKLFEWELAEQVPEYLERIRSWGYNQVRARQLVHNRQEICVAALQVPFRRKGPAVRGRRAGATNGGDPLPGDESD
jgi:23S rRNA (cytidine2498-2'-O)-methyltransferase